MNFEFSALNLKWEHNTRRCFKSHYYDHEEGKAEFLCGNAGGSNCCFVGGYGGNELGSY